MRRLMAYVEAHPLGRWFLNFTLIVLLLALGVYYRNWNSHERNLLCKRHHETVNVLRLFLSEGTKRFELRPVSVEEQESLREFSRETQRLLDTIDCQKSDIR